MLGRVFVKPMGGFVEEGMAHGETPKDAVVDVHSVGLHPCYFEEHALNVFLRGSHFLPPLDDLHQLFGLERESPLALDDLWEQFLDEVATEGHGLLGNPQRALENAPKGRVFPCETHELRGPFFRFGEERKPFLLFYRDEHSADQGAGVQNTGRFRLRSPTKPHKLPIIERREET